VVVVKKLVLLAKANVRKAKGQTAILVMLFLIASMMLNIGIITLAGFGSFFERTTEELNTSDVYFIVPEALFNPDIEQYFQNHSEVTEFQINEGLQVAATFDWRDDSLTNGMSIQNKDEVRNLSQWMYVGERLSDVPDNAIYLPYTFDLVGGHELGDELTLTIDDEDFVFTVAGFTENIYQDRMLLGDTVFVPAQGFQELSDELAEYRTSLIFANGLENYAKAVTELMELADSPSADSPEGLMSTIRATDLNASTEARTGMPVMTSTMVIIFTVVIVAVCLLVIRFRIANSIEEDVQKIGSLQSVGYTSRQITLSFVAQYGLIALLAGLAGILPAYLMLPSLSDVLAQQSGLSWRPDLEPVINLVILAALVFVVIAATFLTAWKVRKVSPVQALRGGLTTHSFKRNYVPLERSRLPLTLALSSKSVLQKMRQSVMLLIILAATSFTAVFAVILFYNSAVDLSAFEQVPGIERSNALIVFDPAEDTDRLMSEVAAHEDVWMAQYMDIEWVHVEDIGTVGAITMTDFSTKVTNNIYEGVPPRYDNEVAIAGAISNMVDLGIGDEIRIGSDEEPFLITGLSQGMQAGVLSVSLTQDGARRISPDFTQSQLMVYLNDGIDAAEFVLEMEEVYYDEAFIVGDMDEAFAEGVSGFASIFSMVGIAIVAIAGFVIVLVLYFVLGSTVIRQRRELGIQKAIGYTTMSLMNQMSIGFTLPIILGTAAGSVLAALNFNTLMAAGGAATGLMRSEMLINPALVAFTALGMIVLSYLISLLITWRIRKVSAYALVTE